MGRLGRGARRVLGALASIPALLRAAAASDGSGAASAGGAGPIPSLFSSEAFPYEVLISETVSHCYNSLIQDSSCCLDQHFAPGVVGYNVHRPGTEWTCNGQCLDDRKGIRGDDKVWVPEGATCTSPRMLWLHGGSWQYGSPTTESYPQLASKLSKSSGAVVMMPDYPLAPIGNYSTIMNESLKALQWLAAMPSIGDVDCKGVQAPLFVGGDSSGGGTALSLVLKLKELAGWSPSGISASHPEALPGGQILAGAVFFSPWTNLRCDGPDYYYNSFSKIVAAVGDVYVGDLMFRGHPEQNLDDFTANAQSYVGINASLLNDPIASPFFARAKELGGGGIPPLYFVVGGSESILGDSLIFAQKAALYGVDVQLDIMVGMWHVFPMYSEGCGLGKELWQASRALNRTALFIRQVGEAKRLATQFGLEWPPSNYRPSTPATSYIYDLTHGKAFEWYPRDLDTIGMQVESLRLAAAGPALGEQAAGPAPATQAVAICSAAFGAVMTVVVQAALANTRAWRQRSELCDSLLAA